jgi:hypothetical protein
LKEEGVMQVFFQIMSLLGILLGFGLTGLGGLILISAPYCNISNGKGFVWQMILGGIVAFVGMILASIS